jgi:hypothetical protein
MCVCVSVCALFFPTRLRATTLGRQPSLIEVPADEYAPSSAACGALFLVVVVVVVLCVCVCVCVCVFCRLFYF